MKRIQTILGAIVVVSASLVVAFSGTVSGASINKGNGMEVAPVRTDLILKPGETKTITVRVRNVTGGNEVLRVVANDFVATDESGAPGLLLNGEANPTHGLKDYMILPDTVTVPKGQQQEVRVTIKMPANIAGGGYYGAVRFIPTTESSNATQQGDSVSLAGSVASLVLVRVPGDITENLQVASLSAAKNGNAGSFFTTGSGLQAIVRFRNAGNVQEQPFGKILVKKGDKVVATYDVNNATPPGNILPDSIRRFTIDLDGKVSGFGKYTLVGNFGYGGGSQALTASTTFFVIPLYMIIGFIVLILLIVGVIWFLKNYKKRILRSARR